MKYQNDTSKRSNRASKYKKIANRLSVLGCICVFLWYVVPESLQIYVFGCFAFSFIIGLASYALYLEEKVQ